MRTTGLACHLLVDARIAVEGVVLVAPCTCGGRAETMLDLRGLSGVETARQVYQTLDIAAPDTPAATIRRWAQSHRDCTDSTVADDPDDRVIVHTHAMWETAIRGLKHGHTPLRVQVLFANRQPFDIERPGLDADDDATEQVLVAETHAAIRELARCENTSVIGAVAVTGVVIETARDRTAPSRAPHGGEPPYRPLSRSSSRLRWPSGLRQPSRSQPAM